MSDPALLIAPVTALALLHYLLVGRRRGVFNVDGMFVLSNWVMAVGTLWILRDPNLATPGYATVIAVPTCIYIATSILLFSAETARSRTPHAGPPKQSVTPVDLPRHDVLLGLLLLSLAITLLYYVSVGYNVLALGIRGLLSGESEDYTTLRLNSYASSRYLFPGYVNQFKNVILPTLIAVWIHARHVGSSKPRPGGTVLLSLIAVFSLLGTGQRGAFVLFAIVVLLFLQRSDPGNFRRRVPRLVAVVLPLMLLTTLLLGRSSERLSSATGALGQVGVLLGELGKRFLYDNQWSGTMAFRYISDRPTQWGNEWAQAVLGILPTNSGSTLAQEVFAYLYGTNRGTAPISMWGSVYYNFEWFGLLLVPVLLALAWHRVVSYQDSVPQPNSLEVASACGVAAIAGMWVVGGPEYLFNAGAVAAAILWGIGVQLRRRDAESSRGVIRAGLPPRSHERHVVQPARAKVGGLSHGR